MATLTNGELAIDVLSVQHVRKDMAIARYRWRNLADDKQLHITDTSNFFDYWESDASISRFALVDLNNSRRYRPPSDAKTSKCLCTNLPADEWGITLEPGGKPTYTWAAYALPSGVSSVAVQDSNGLGLVDGIPVSPADADLPQVKGEPNAGGLDRKDDGEVALYFRSDSTTQHTRSKGRTVTVDVSADVLFGFDEATLTAKAGAELDRVAARLEREAGNEIRVTGYTDSKGSNSYNLELSKKRAKAVHKALDERIDKPTEFEVAGKGEANPVAPNRKNGQDNPEGRKRNRRVEISYKRTARQQPDEPTQTADTPTGNGNGELGKPLTGSEPDTRGLRVQITGLHRITHAAKLTFTITNTASKPIDVDQWADPPDGYPGSFTTYHGGDAYWVNLEDSSHTKYWVIAAEDARCVCSRNLQSLQPGDTRTTWAALTGPPPGTDTVDVHLSGYGTVHDVPLRA